MAIIYTLVTTIRAKVVWRHQIGVDGFPAQFTVCSDMRTSTVEVIPHILSRCFSGVWAGGASTYLRNNYCDTNRRVDHQETLSR